MGGVLVHEWIAEHGGSEKVLDQMVRTFPDADIVCLWNDALNRYPSRKVAETWLAKTPLRKSKALAIPFMLRAWRGLHNEAYEWALISSHLFAHHASFRNAPADFRKYVYVHTPARYIWTPELDHRGNSSAARFTARWLKLIDRRRAQEATELFANSHFVRERIQRFWERDARVIHPPVDVERIQSVLDWRAQLSATELRWFEELPSTFLLGASRFIRYKRLDLVISAGELSDLPVVLAGAGPLEAKLRARAEDSAVPVFLAINPSDALLYALYQSAIVFVFPATEDFGIMPVEAMAAGTPVVVSSHGGAKESLGGVPVGAIFSSESPTSLVAAVSAAASCDTGLIRQHSRRFSQSVFSASIKAAVLSETVGDL